MCGQIQQHERCDVDYIDIFLEIIIPEAFQKKEIKKKTHAETIS